jgi:hypothetical protein
MNKEDLEYSLYILLGSLTGLIGLVAALFIAYIANYKRYGRIIISFIIGWIIYAIFIGPGLTHTGVLLYDLIVGIIAIVTAYIIKKDRSKSK